MAEFDLTIAAVFWVAVITIVFLVVFFASRYYKFKTNEYVIHLRGGKVRSAGRGGKIIKLPLIDDIIVIPTTTRQTLLNSREKILSREFQDMNIVGMLYWRVADPQIAFSAVSWEPRSPDYAEKILATATEAIIRTTCASLEIEKIISERASIIQLVTSQLHNLTADWGIVIESFEILEVNVLDGELKKNMETVKKSIEERNARLAMANSQETYRLRELEVQEKVGIAQEQTNLKIAMVQKNREIQIAEQDRKRIEVEAGAKKAAEIIQAEGDAEAIKLKELAQLQVDADAIRAKMLAQAEGFKKQIEAMSTADDKFLAVKLIETLPSIFENLRPDKMFVMGEGKEGFNSIVQSVLPFMDLLPEFASKMKDKFGTLDEGKNSKKKA
jgi:regulator of protease activity HflC (stomatin/prohibitin superfamily)